MTTYIYISIRMLRLYDGLRDWRDWRDERRISPTTPQLMLPGTCIMQETAQNCPELVKLIAPNWTKLDNIPRI